jgi:hypothetical protein
VDNFACVGQLRTLKLPLYSAKILFNEAKNGSGDEKYNDLQFEKSL